MAAGFTGSVTSWTWNGSPATCGSCHGFPPTVSHTGVLAAATDCNRCHGGTVNLDGSINVAGGLHINGQLDGGGEPNTGGSNCGGCHTDYFNKMTAVTGLPVSRHGLGSDVPTDSGASWTGTDLNTSVALANRTCISMCHGDHPHTVTSPAAAGHANNVFLDATTQATRAVTATTLVGTGGTGTQNRARTDFDTTLNAGPVRELPPEAHRGQRHHRRRRELRVLGPRLRDQHRGGDDLHLELRAPRRQQLRPQLHQVPRQPCRGQHAGEHDHARRPLLHHRREPARRHHQPGRQRRPTSPATTATAPRRPPPPAPRATGPARTSRPRSSTPRPPTSRATRPTPTPATTRRPSSPTPPSATHSASPPAPASATPAASTATTRTRRRPPPTRRQLHRHRRHLDRRDLSGHHGQRELRHGHRPDHLDRRHGRLEDAGGHHLVHGRHLHQRDVDDRLPASGGGGGGERLLGAPLLPGHQRRRPGAAGRLGREVRRHATAWTAPTTANFTKTTMSAGTDLEATLCFKCHTGFYGTLPTSPSAAFTETDVAKEFNPANVSFHPILATASGEPRGDRQHLAALHQDHPDDVHRLPRVGRRHRPQRPARLGRQVHPARDRTPTWTSTVVLNSSTGMPAGTFCANCHRTDFVGGRFTNHTNGQHNIACFNCHAAIPHGGPRAGMLNPGAGAAATLRRSHRLGRCRALLAGRNDKPALPEDLSGDQHHGVGEQQLRLQRRDRLRALARPETAAGILTAAARESRPIGGSPGGPRLLAPRSSTALTRKPHPAARRLPFPRASKRSHTSFWSTAGLSRAQGTSTYRTSRANLAM